MLESFLNLNNVNLYSPDPTNRTLGNNSVLSLLGQEAGHRWLSYVQFDSDPDSGINASSALLGRSNSHWSFFLHTASATSSVSNPEASSMEGNFWQPTDPPPISFQSMTITNGFSPLDLYLMGLLPADQVPPFWYIKNPSSVNPPANPGTGPRAGTFAQGTQQFVTIDDIIQVEGPRIPGAEESPKIFRQAFILLTLPGTNVTQQELDRMETYRIAWERYFAKKTLNRGAVVTNLRDVLFVDQANPRSGDGSRDNPFRSLPRGIDRSENGGMVIITRGRFEENLLIDKPVTLRAVLGSVTIGN